MNISEILAGIMRNKYKIAVKSYNCFTKSARYWFYDRLWSKKSKFAA